jgi:hypothetical protein
VPAKVAGEWHWSLPVAGRTHHYALALTQHYQQLSGTLRAGAQAIPLGAATLAGDRIMLDFAADIDGIRVLHQRAGRVGSHMISGTATVVRDGVPAAVGWSARRTASSPTAAE